MTDRAEHTPGPWIVRHTVTGHGDDNYLVLFNEKFVLGEVRGRWASEVNARLMAAAPDMLEAMTGADRVISILLEQLGGDMDMDPMDQAMLNGWSQHYQKTLSKALGDPTTVEGGE